MSAPARRKRLAELDELTDQIGPLLDRMAATWRNVERDLTGRRKLLATCPTCHGPLRSLLATCRKPACLAADLNHEMAHVRREDV